MSALPVVEGISVFSFGPCDKETFDRFGELVARTDGRIMWGLLSKFTQVDFDDREQPDGTHFEHQLALAAYAGKYLGLTNEYPIVIYLILAEQVAGRVNKYTMLTVATLGCIYARDAAYSFIELLYRQLMAEVAKQS